MDPFDLLDLALQRYSVKEVAAALSVNPKTVRRWLSRETEPKPYLVDAIKARLLAEKPKAANPEFRFIDLFAGIGGMRLAFEKEGGQCVFTSEWDPYARKTYEANFKDSADHVFKGDITQVSVDEVPEHDILLAGFPCQPFSIAGVSKKNALGRPHGFADKTQGTLFFDVARIIEAKQPKAFLLENVKNLVGHDGGRTLDTILDVLKELGYTVRWKVVNGKHFVPQHRERILIVGFKDIAFPWEDLVLPAIENGPKMAAILHRQDGSEPEEWPWIEGPKGRVKPKYTLSDKLWSYLKTYAEKHREKGNGFGYGLVKAHQTCRTLSARYYKDGSEILIDQRNKNPRRLTPRECARLMGFGDGFHIPVSDTRAYKQFGNSVVVPVISAVAKLMVPLLAGPGLEQRKAA